MKPKSLAIAAVSALVLIAVGLGVQELRRAPQAASHSGKLLFPDLLDKINEVAVLAVETPEGSYRITRRDGIWGLEEKGGYPVDAGQVSKALITLAELETVEAKTSNPSRYADLGVQDVGTEGASSKLIALQDAKGTELASLIVGERRSGPGTPTLFVRKTGEAGSWLVSGDLQVSEESGSWLDKKILELKRADVRAVATTQPDGESLLVSKAGRDATDFDVQDMPAERELKYATVANGMGSALEYLNLQDVLPAAGFEAPEGEPVRTSFWTFDGLRVDVALYDKDAKAYATFRASYDAEGPQGLAQPVGPLPPGEEGDEEAPVAEVTRPESEVRAEAEKLDARLSPWVFEIPAYNKTNLVKKLDDLLAEPEPVEATEPEGGTPSEPLFGEDGEPLDDETREELERQLQEFLEQQEQDAADEEPILKDAEAEDDEDPILKDAEASDGPAPETDEPDGAGDDGR